MPLAFFPFAGPLPRGPRNRRAEVTLGVFSHGGDWKVYSATDGAEPYPSRREALVAAEARAFAAARAGRRVELFVQDEDGSLSQAPIELN